MKLSALLASPIENDLEVGGLTDDTRGLSAGEVMVWDARFKPALTDTVLAEARAKGAAAIVTNVQAAGVVYHENPGAVLSRYAAAAWPRQPEVVLGVTGTSGKTSVAWFGQQMLAAAGYNGASVGTLGTVRASEVVGYSGYTSPSALKMHPLLQDLADDGVTHAVCEVSSHALALSRMDGVRFAAAGITNVTQDHFDFHGNFDTYMAAKARLFTEVLPEDGVAVVNVMREELWPLTALCKQRGLRMLSVGTANAELVVEVVEAHAQGIDVKLKYDAVPVPVRLPLVGGFQAENLAVSLGLLLAGGVPWEKLVRAVEEVSSVPGRMEMIAGAGKPTVLVDYAHKPDALARALAAAKPLAAKSGGKLWVVFGCGGDRDATKRPLMGKIAAEIADEIVVTDDNPRTEAAAPIRAQIVAGVVAGGGVARDIGDRRAAIAAALDGAAANDLIVVAGKGHESGQEVNRVVTPFDDRVVVRELLGRMTL